ncbi:MAG TPA: AraC family transcriptional regulator [Vicinamibacterales bacterium]|nr:AraC family transcriptional regulator [Vicinamibacterales bacterium]
MTLASVPSQGQIREFRVDTVHPLFRGEAQVVELEGIGLFRARYQVPRPVTIYCEQESPQLFVHVGLRGHTVTRTDGVPGPLSDEPPGVDVVYTPATRTGLAIRRDYEVFLVNFPIAALRRWAKRYPELLENVADRIERGAAFALSRRTALPTPTLLAMIDALMNSHRHGPLRELYVEAKVLELLIHQLGPVPDLPRASAPDVDRMMGARDRLLAQLKDPPTIDELAHLVGTNAFRLKRDFKAVFGRGIRAFVLAQRHEMARALLLDTRLSIKDVAARIGYSDVAHFSVAFKRHQGVPPSVLRGRRDQERD